MDDIWTWFGILLNRITTKDTTNSPPHILMFSLNKMTTRNDWDSQLYNKRDDFNSPIVNFPFFCSNIPEVPTYRAYTSQRIRYYRTFVILIGSGLPLSSNLLTQRLMATNKLCLSHSWLWMCFPCYNISPFLFASRTILMLLWPWISQSSSYMNGWPDIRELTFSDSPELTFVFFPYYFSLFVFFFFLFRWDLCWSSLVFSVFMYLSFVLFFCIVLLFI